MNSYNRRIIKGYKYKIGADPYLDNILELRRKGFTYDEVAALMGEKTRWPIYDYCRRRGIFEGKVNKTYKKRFYPVNKQKIDHPVWLWDRIAAYFRRRMIG